MLRLDDIFDQSRAMEQLRRAYLADRLPHGLIFAGPVGVGKGTTAMALAGLFLCEHPTGDQPCGVCPSCAVFMSGNHPDYHVITKELIRYHDKTGKSKGIELSIHVVRPEVVDKAAMKSAMGRGKVFVIEQSETMNAAAQNSLLKTLEEPPGRCLIILLTDQPSLLLNTVRSRCQAVQFAALKNETVIRELERRKISSGESTAAVRYANGSLGTALRWIEDGVIDRAAQLENLLDQVSNPATDLPDWFKNAADDYAAKQLERDPLGSKDQATREGLILYLKLAAEYFRQRLSEQDDDIALLKTCEAIDVVARAEEYLDSNVNIALVFQQLTLALSR